MKKMIVLLIVLASFICGARSLTDVNRIDGNALHTIQSAWIFADQTTSAGTEPTALSDTERTKKIVDALIAADSSGDGEISILLIPPKWNSVRIRNIAITEGGTTVNQIYLGTLGGGLDCELSHAGQLTWTTGTQQSIYDQITFTSGGAYEPKPEEVVTGNTSGETAVVVSVLLSSGAWADGDAAGTITYKSASGAFTSGETIKIVNPRGVTQADVLTHAASDLIDFELADTVVIVPGAWGSTWSSVSPANDTNAEAELEVKGADIMIVVTTTASVDGKLLIRGY